MRITLLLFSLIILFSCKPETKEYFEVKKIESSILRNESKSNHPYFGLQLKGSNNLTYPIDVSNFSEEQKLQMIAELLNFKDDKRLCIYPVSNYNPKLSQIYNGTEKDYSLQVEALFLINQIFFEKPFYYSPMPVLVNSENSIEEAINGKNISDAYLAYESWYQDVKKSGFERAKKDKNYPLSKIGISWIYGNN